MQYPCAAIFVQANTKKVFTESLMAVLSIWINLVL